jgi:glucan 1,3-beta-glucosidase
VLEAWITPSLFYQFTGKKGPDEVGQDSYTFCEVLNRNPTPGHANAVMQAHWEAWVTQDMITQLSQKGVELIRVPIGDWTFTPYGPYASQADGVAGCMDGAKDWIKKILDWAEAANIKVLLDVHAMKGSQNGFDNSGVSNKTSWVDDDNFTHWDTAWGEWMGTWDNDIGGYSTINWANVQWAIQVSNDIIAEWGTHKAFYALEPLNEPWWSSDISILKTFYRQVRANLKAANPDIKFVFHDSFHGDAATWNDMFDDDDMENVVMDHHFYQAWYARNDDGCPTGDYTDVGQTCLDFYCQDYINANEGLSEIKYDVWIGEWSLATDTCAMWLGGFNDGNSIYQYECARVDCPAPYVTDESLVPNLTAD